VSNQPGDAYRQHHDVEAPRVDDRAFRQGWRVVTRLDGLLAEGRITTGTWQAAAEYRDAWDALRQTSTGSGSGGSLHVETNGARDRHPGRLDRIARINAAEHAIGATSAGLCRACILDDVSWHALGQYLGVRNVTARDRTVDALGALATAWRDGTTRRRTGGNRAEDSRGV
jgi:hypothetical protein